MVVRQKCQNKTTAAKTNLFQTKKTRTYSNASMKVVMGSVVKNFLDPHESQLGAAQP